MTDGLFLSEGQLECVLLDQLVTLGFATVSDEIIDLDMTQL